MDTAAIQAGVQTTLRALASFADADVVIGSYTILDQPTGNAPYVIIEDIENGDISEGPGGTEYGTMELPLTVFVSFDGWETSGNALRDYRDEIVNGFNGDDWTANGIQGINIESVRWEPRIEVYEPSVEQPISDPVYLGRPMMLVMRAY